MIHVNCVPASPGMNQLRFRCTVNIIKLCQRHKTYSIRNYVNKYIYISHHHYIKTPTYHIINISNTNTSRPAASCNTFFLWRDHLHDRSIFSCLLGGLTGAFFANLPVVRWFGVTPGFDTVRLGCDRTTHDAIGIVWLISRDCLNKGCSGIIGYRVRDRISNRRHLDLTASRPWICATARVNVDTGTS